MRSYGPFTIAATNMPTPLISGSSQGVDNHADKIVFFNLSPFTLFINANDGKNPNKKIMPYDRDIIQAGPQFDGNILYTAVSDLTFAGSPPSTILYVETFGPTEEVQGTYPASLNYLTNVGGIVANKITNVGETPPQQIIYCLPTGYVSPTMQWQDDGFFAVFPKSFGNIQSGYALAVTVGGSSTYAQVQMDAQKIVTDGQGHMSAVGFKQLAGNQETGYCGVEDGNGASGAAYGQGVNAKTTWPSVPSSITFTVITHGLVGTSESAHNINTVGFFFEVVASGTGDVFSECTYVTVGL